MFSVIVPLYNKAPYIKRCIDSVLSQDLDEFEVIVVDDGSTDGSILALAPINDPRLRIIRKENSGEGAARNTGIAASHFEWVAFLDADDYWFPDHLSELRKIIELCPEAALVSTRLIAVREGDKPGEISQDNSIEYIDYFLRSISDTSFVSSSTAALNVNIVGKEKLFGKYTWGADVRCWVEVASQHRVGISNKITAIYYTNTGGIIDNYISSNRLFKREIRGLGDISPAVEFAWGRASSTPGIVGKSMGAYARVLSWGFVKSCLYNEFFTAARDSSLVLSKYSRKFVFLYLALSIPLIPRLMVKGYKKVQLMAFRMR